MLAVFGVHMFWHELLLPWHQSLLLELLFCQFLEVVVVRYLDAKITMKWWSKKGNLLGMTNQPPTVPRHMPSLRLDGFIKGSMKWQWISLKRFQLSCCILAVIIVFPGFLQLFYMERCFYGYSKYIATIHVFRSSDHDHQGTETSTDELSKAWM